MLLLIIVSLQLKIGFLEITLIVPDERKRADWVEIWSERSKRTLPSRTKIPSPFFTLAASSVSDETDAVSLQDAVGPGRIRDHDFTRLDVCVPPSDCP